MRLIYGAGGHGRVVCDALRAAGVEPDGFVDDGVTGVIDDLPVFGGGPGVPPGSHEVFLGIGANATRRRVAQAVLAAGHRLGTAVHPRAWVSPRATIGAGSVVFAGVVVNTGARVGQGAILNTGCVVEHDCVVGAWAHLSPNASLGGAARVGEGAWVGIGATVRHEGAVGDWATLGAGGVAVRPVPEGEVWAGVPARRLR